MFYVYILKNDKEKIYIGISENLKRRLRDHNNQRGSFFTKSGNFEMVFKEEHLTLKEARHREIQIKKWRRDKKEILIKRYQAELDTKV